MNILPRMTLAVFAVTLAGLAFDAAAQSPYPSKSIRIVVPFPPGGSTDFLARGIGQQFTATWGQPVIIDNRSGGAGIVATDIVAKAAPDGHTLLMNAINHTVNPSLYSKLPYDTLRDFAALALVADVPILLIVRPQLGVNSVKELIALARAKPGHINVAAGGIGSSSHLAPELFRSAAKIEWQTIQYKGGAPAFVDLLAGQVDLMFISVSTSIQHVKAGRLKALGAAGSKRVAQMPELPTIAEAGLPGYESRAWYGLVAPARVSQDILAKLNKEINVALQNPEFRDANVARGAELSGGSREEFADLIRRETAKYAKLVKESGMKAE